MLSYIYVFHGVYNTYDDDIYSGVHTLTTHPADTSSFSISYALHSALNSYYSVKGYWSSFSVVHLDTGGKDDN